MMHPYVKTIMETPLMRRTGIVTMVSSHMLEANGPDSTIGTLCEVATAHGGPLQAEVVGVKTDRIVLMPYGDPRGVRSGSEVSIKGAAHAIPVGPEWLGRVVDAFGHPLDGRPAPVPERQQPLHARPLNPMQRPRISRILETGVRAIDCALPLGQGQRMGIFAGSGVGKSTLLGMLARKVHADINVIALIGERGREVREFVERQLGPEGLRRSVVVVATSDQPAIERVRAAHAATAIAEYFRDQGKQVLLMMDSITRFAMARREIGIAAGEPPTSRGYTPSVFVDIPALCERCGTSPSGGSITALYTVLVEGDDFNEPLTDILRATLDGHIVLSRTLAQAGHFPAIHILHSVSRLANELATDEERGWMNELVSLLATYDRNRQMIDLGVYQAGANKLLDQAMRLMPSIDALLRQATTESSSRAQALMQLKQLLQKATP